MGWIAICENDDCAELGIAKRSLGVDDELAEDAEVLCGACQEVCAVEVSDDPARWSE